MKQQIIFLITFLVLTEYSNGQGNLQFSQVLRIGNSAQTVPSGKVWKVEAYMQANTFITEFTEYPGCSYPERQHPFLINSVPYYQINGSPGHGSSGIMMAVGNLFPLWLKSGEILQTTCPNNFLSVIEYNIVP